MSQGYRVVTTFSSAELQKRITAGEITFEDWSALDPEYLAKTLFPNAGGIPRDNQQAESTVEIDNTDSLDSNDMFVKSASCSGLPRGESDDEEPGTDPVTVAGPDETTLEAKKRGRPRILVSRKERNKSEKQQKKAEEEEKKNIALCARYQVVLENNPWHYKRNSTGFIKQWTKIVKQLKELNLLDNAPNSARQFQTSVSKALTDYEKVFIKRPTGEEPPEKAEKDSLIGDMYDLKKSGEGLNPEAEDRDIGKEKRNKAKLRLGMSTGNTAASLRNISAYDEWDEREIPTSEDEAMNGPDAGYVGRLNREETYELDFAGPEFQKGIPADVTGDSSQPAAKKKRNTGAKNADQDGEADDDDAGGEPFMDVDSPRTSGNGSGERKRKGDHPVAAYRGKKKDVVDAIMSFTDRANDQGQIQWKVWSAEQREIEADRKFQREIEKQKFDLEKEKMDREEESRKKDRELDLQKHLATVNAMRDIFCDIMKKKLHEKPDDA